jgi:predicted PurR-regulated permease PerM
VKQFFNGAGFYRWGMLVGTIGIAIFLGVGVYYVVDYFTRFILPYPWNFIASVFVAVFIEYKAVSLFMNGFQAIETMKETHRRKKEKHEQQTRTRYGEWSGQWSVWLQFGIVVIMDSAGNFFRIYIANQDAGRSWGAFVIYECLVFLPFLAGYSIYKQISKPIEMYVEDHEREYTIQEIEQSHKERTQALKNRSKQIAPPQTVTGEFEEFDIPEKEDRTVNFPQARRLNQ